MTNAHMISVYECINSCYGYSLSSQLDAWMFCSLGNSSVAMIGFWINGSSPWRSRREGVCLVTCLGSDAVLGRTSIAIMSKNQNDKQKLTAIQSFPESTSVSMPNESALIPSTENSQTDSRRQSPIDSCSLLSYVTFWWVNTLVHEGYRQGLTEKHVYSLPRRYASPMILKRFHKEWELELECKGIANASLGKAFLRTFKTRILITFILATITIGISIIGPVIFLRGVISYSQRIQEKLPVGLGYAFALTLSEIFRLTAIQMYWFSANRYSINFRALVIALDLRDFGSYSVGELVNICTNDSQRLFDAASKVTTRLPDLSSLVHINNISTTGIYSPFIYVSFLAGIIVTALAIYLIGPAALAGSFIFFLTLPVQALFASSSGKLRHLALKSTDQRVQLMNEILTNIKLIKMYAWESSFALQIQSVRNKERQTLQRAGYFQSITVSLVPIAPALASVVTFIIQAYFGTMMKSEDVFTVVALFIGLQFCISVLPLSIKAGAEAQVGFHRLRKFLLLENNRFTLSPPDATLSWPAVASKDSCKQEEVSQQHDDAGPKSSDEKSGSDEPTSMSVPNLKKPKVGNDHIVLRGVHLSVPKGALVGICGAVGSGKSTLLSTLLGQVKVLEGQACVGGTLAYVSQQAWIQSESLIGNILFEQEYDNEFYNKVIDACSLRVDIEMLPDGEQTEIGERGINLSGGQKQRISLARAVYANRDIYLLDDPLSAVDAHVGKSIFQKCIKGILANRTILLVTHQLQYLPACDIVCFLENGRAQIGRYTELLEKVPVFSELVRKYQCHQNNSEEIIDQISGTNFSADAIVRDQSNESNYISTRENEGVKTETSSVDHRCKKEIQNINNDTETLCKGHLVEEEEIETGDITAQTYLNYVQSGGGVALALLILLAFFLAMFSKAYGDYYLSFWIRQGNGTSTSRADQGDPGKNPNIDTYALIYGMIIVALLTFQIVKGMLFVRQTLVASTNLHYRIFEKVVCAPMSFFDTTPSGRILNRFSKDLDEIDIRLPFFGELLLQNTTLLIVTLCMIAYIIPWFLIAAIPLTTFFVFLVRFVRPAQRQLKRLENTTRSPLLSQLSSTLQGVHTIAAFGKQHIFLNKFFGKLDINSKCLFSFYCVTRWLSFRLDYTTAMMVFVVSIITISMHGDINPEDAALALTYVLSMASIFQYTMRLTAEVEARFTSVERIHRLATDTPQEPGHKINTPIRRISLRKDKGRISFQHVTLSYRPNLPPALEDVCFDIFACEKIGIVGRTGAGKSTITLALFRLMELSSGRIEIDGVDISSISVPILRSRLSIIPQDPVLFVGSIRYNLDPFDEHTDENIWTALERAHIKSMVTSLSIGLETQVVENGENFSVGERQLLCMARALLRHSTILVLDEATAAIDVHTDALIQKTIREEFADRTVLTIAHRLNTILDSDLVLVLSEGKVVEFDNPDKLAAMKGSVFSNFTSLVFVTNLKMKTIDIFQKKAVCVKFELPLRQTIWQEYRSLGVAVHICRASLLKRLCRSGMGEGPKI
eukprot:gene6554-319_t